MASIGSGTRYRILSWRGIPSAVRVWPEEGRPLSRSLSARWQQEIDRVAMRETLTEKTAYTEQFQWSEDLERPGTAEEVLAAVVAELEATWESVRARDLR